MNYTNIYNNLIDKARSRMLTGYVERHHIIPRCMGGSDDLTNFVVLTPEEHYLAHQLLVKMYPESHALIRAAHMMTVHNGSRINNKKFGWLRRKMSIVLRDAATGRQQSSETRAKRSAALIGNKNRIGKKTSEETKQLLSSKLKGKKKEASHKQKISESHKKLNKTLSETQKQSLHNHLFIKVACKDCGRLISQPNLSRHEKTHILQDNNCQ